MGLLGKLFGRTVDVELVTYEPESRSVLVTSTEELELKEYSCRAQVAEHRLKCKILFESKEAGLYYGKFLEPEEAVEYLQMLLPQPKKWEDQRAAPRVERHLRVTSHSIPNYQAISEDLSLTGIKLRTDAPMPPGELFEVLIEIDDHTLSQLKLTCEVRWSRPVGRQAHVGVLFVDIPPGTRARLAYFIQSLTEVEKGVLKGSYTVFD